MENLVTNATEIRPADRNQCNNCGSFVSRRFSRVFGNNEDEVYGCLQCSTMRDLREGGGVTRESL